MLRPGLSSRRRLRSAITATPTVPGGSDRRSRRSLRAWRNSPSLGSLDPPSANCARARRAPVRGATGKDRRIRTDGQTGGRSHSLGDGGRRARRITQRTVYSAAVETSSGSTSVSVIPSGTACNPTPPRSSRAASAASSSAVSRGGSPNIARASSSEIVGSPVV